jgi:hypothetical protein
MTLVLGARCTDGVVIMTDMKITSMATGTPEFLRYEPKISGVFTNIIFGYAGDVDTYEVFVNYAVGDLVRKRDDPNDVYNSNNFIQKLTENMVKLRTILARNGRPLSLRVLVGRQFPEIMPSDLHLVSSSIPSPEDTSNENIETYRVVGDTETCATDLIKGKWSENMTMREFAELSYSVIRFIEEKNISVTIGLGNNKPPTRYLSNSGITDTELSDEEWELLRQMYPTYRKYFESIITISNCL